MNTPKSSRKLSFIFSLNAAVLSLLCAQPASAEMREFKSSQGTVIRAELKKVKGAMIILRKEDGKEIQTTLTSFSADDQNYILKWMAEDPAALDYNFSVVLDEKQLADSKKKDVKEYERAATVQKFYNLSIQNSSHNKIDDLSVDWCSYMLNKVDLRSSNYMFSERSTGDLMVKHGSERIPDMMPSRTFSLATKPFNIDSIIDKYYTGAKVKDKLQGVWLRFYRKDTLVFEWKSPGLPKMEWSGGAHKSSPKVEIAKNDAPSNKSSGVKPAGTDGKVVEKDDDAGEIVKIFELEEGMTMKK